MTRLPLEKGHREIAKKFPYSCVHKDFDKISSWQLPGRSDRSRRLIPLPLIWGGGGRGGSHLLRFVVVSRLLAALPQSKEDSKQGERDEEEEEEE